MIDPDCLKLAEKFLPPDADQNMKDGLAQAFQQTAETWLLGFRAGADLVRSLLST